jgi:cobalamin biosynthesis Mg chelatase CobN
MFDSFVSQLFSGKDSSKRSYAPICHGTPRQISRRYAPLPQRICKQSLSIFQNMRFLILLLIVFMVSCSSSRQVQSTASETLISHSEADSTSTSHSESISSMLFDRDCVIEGIVVEYSTTSDSTTRASPSSALADTPKVIRIDRISSKSSLSASQSQSTDATSVASTSEDTQSQADEVSASNTSSSAFHPPAYLIILIGLAVSGWLYYRYRRTRQ